MSNVSAGYSYTLDSVTITPGGDSSATSNSFSFCVASIGDAIAGIFSSNSYEMTFGFAASALDACTPPSIPPSRSSTSSTTTTFGGVIEEEPEEELEEIICPVVAAAPAVPIASGSFVGDKIEIKLKFVKESTDDIEYIDLYINKKSSKILYDEQKL